MDGKIESWITRARKDKDFARINERFNTAGIQNWLLDDEKPLLFSIGAYAPGHGVIVEIGSYQGGSASFLAAGIRSRGKGHLYCIDPHLGGPPWLGMAPHQHTLEIFQQKMKYCDLDRWVTSKIGDSAAVASIWPAEPIDAFFVDGDHSFRGALKDFESWLPKVRDGGYVLIDDADDHVLVELLDFIEFIKGLSCVKYVCTVEGVAVFQRKSTDPWTALQELSQACAKRGINRPWDYGRLHGTSLPAKYGASRSWPSEHALDIAYQLCFLARCASGPYGYSSSTRPGDREVFHSLSRDRGDGDVLQVVPGKLTPKLRAVLCSIDEVQAFAPLLLPGGVMITREKSSDPIATRSMLISAGLEGCGFEGGVHWGVWQPSYLSPDAVIDYATNSCFSQRPPRPV